MVLNYTKITSFSFLLIQDSVYSNKQATQTYIFLRLGNFLKSPIASNTEISLSFKRLMGTNRETFNTSQMSTDTSPWHTGLPRENGALCEAGRYLPSLRLLKRRESRSEGKGTQTRVHCESLGACKGAVAKDRLRKPPSSSAQDRGLATPTTPQPCLPAYSSLTRSAAETGTWRCGPCKQELISGPLASNSTGFSNNNWSTNKKNTKTKRELCLKGLLL